MLVIVLFTWIDAPSLAIVWCCGICTYPVIGLPHVAEAAGVNEIGIFGFKLNKEAFRRKVVNMKANWITVGITVVAVAASTVKVGSQVFAIVSVPLLFRYVPSLRYCISKYQRFIPQARVLFQRSVSLSDQATHAAW